MKPALSEPAAGQLKVNAPLTVHHVPRVYKESLAFASKDNLPSVIDLSSVDRFDSAGLALLLEWETWARAHGHHFEFVGVADHLIDIAELSEVDDMLSLHARDPS